MGALEEAEVGEDGEGAVGAGLAEEAELLALAGFGFALEAEGGVGEAAGGVCGGEVAHEGDEGIGPGEEGGVVGDGEGAGGAVAGAGVEVQDEGAGGVGGPGGSPVVVGVIFRFWMQRLGRIGILGSGGVSETGEGLCPKGWAQLL